MIPLRRALRLGEAPQIAFVGAGGKSSAIFVLARQFTRPVLVTTSTHLSTSQANSGDNRITIGGPSALSALGSAPLPSLTVLVGPNQTEDRVSGLNFESLNALSDFARKNNLPLLIEADGARLRALKAPA